MRTRRGPRTALAALALALAALASLLPARAGALPSTPIALGVFVPETFSHPGRIAAYGRQVGRPPAFVIS
ncbi:MAG TPA: hypothetical protein VKH20_09110, partial [Solirubrobacterales bacterium]|nr:hypothetical protein [Solirubrobacterales bacterium]